VPENDPPFDNLDEDEMEKPLLSEDKEQAVSKIDQRADQLRMRDKEDDGLKLVETVFDNKTRLILFSMINKNYFNELGGAISTGKEANVYYATKGELGVAVKIFRIDAPSFRKMRPYIEGDHRFKRVRSSRSGFIEMWARKEFKNLKRMRTHDIPCPSPIYVERNILIMDFLGHKDAVLPRLKDVDPIRPSSLYKRIMESVKILYRKAHLVHADLSEFNILYNNETDQFYIIDVSQSILKDHPRANEFLIRDLFNLNRYFKQYGVDVINLQKLFKWVSGDTADEALILAIEQR